MADSWWRLRRRLPGPQDSQGRPRGSAAGYHFVFRLRSFVGVRPLQVMLREDKRRYCVVNLGRGNLAALLT